MSSQAIRHIVAAPFRPRPNPIMIFGMGTHTHAGSRSSVGYLLVGRLGQRLKCPFHRFTHGNAYIAHYAPENLLLVQPDTYFVRDNLHCMRRIVHHFDVYPTRSVLIYHEPALPLGTVEYRTKGRTDHNLELNRLAREFKSEIFPRIAVGVDFPDQSTRFVAPFLHEVNNSKANFDELFLNNKFPFEHWVRIHEEVLPKTFAALDRAIGAIRHEFPLSDVSDNELRGDSTWGTDTNPKPVHVGPIEEELTYDEDEFARKLWDVRRKREGDPEFARLLKNALRDDFNFAETFPPTEKPDFEAAQEREERRADGQEGQPEPEQQQQQQQQQPHQYQHQHQNAQPNRGPSPRREPM